MALLMTETSNVSLSRVCRYGQFVFLQSDVFFVNLLCRVLGQEEFVDRAPDAVLRTGRNEEERLVIVSDAFKSAESAFECVKCNEKRVNEFMLALNEMKNELDNEIAADDKASDKNRVLCYEYLYNYFGGDKFDNKVIDGAAVDISFRPYINGELVSVTEELTAVVKEPSKISDKPRISQFWLFNIVDVQFDRESLIKMEMNEDIKRLFLEQYGWDDIVIQIESYNLSYKESPYVSVPFDVKKEDWESFLRNHLDDFDISDNVHAQCPSYSLVEA